MYNPKLYYIEMYVAWCDKWYCVRTAGAARPKGFATRREALMEIDNVARNYRGFHRFRVVKGNREICYKGVTT